MFVACSRQRKQGAQKNGSTRFEHAEMILLFSSQSGRRDLVLMAGTNGGCFDNRQNVKFEAEDHDFSRK